MNVILTEAQLKGYIKNIIKENKMRCYKYLPEIKKMAGAFYEGKTKSYYLSSLGVNYVLIPDYVFRQYGFEENGFYNREENIVVIKDNPNMSLLDLISLISHETEHVIDINTNGNLSIEASIINNTLKPSNKEERALKDVIYKLWINTERNAYASTAILSKQHSDNFFKVLKDELEILKDIPYEGNENFWDEIDILNVNRKRFLQKSYSLLNKLEKTYFKKRVYSDMMSK